MTTDPIGDPIGFASQNLPLLQWLWTGVVAAVTWLITKVAAYRTRIRHDKEERSSNAEKLDGLIADIGRLTDRLENIESGVAKTQAANIASWQAYIRQAYRDHVGTGKKPTIAESQQIHNVIKALVMFDDAEGSYQQMVDEIDDMGIYTP